MTAISPLGGVEASRARDPRPFVGRASELAELRQALDCAAAGRGRAFFIAGEPGIGKTRLCDQVSVDAARLELLVVWGRCWEAGGAPAYWPWLEVLQSLASTLDDRALDAALGDGAAAFAELVPSVRGRLPRAQARGGELRTGDEARFRLYHAVLELLRTCVRARGAVIVIDDLHAADEASLQLLRFVAREARGLRALVLATYRDQDPRWNDGSRRVLAQLGREGVTMLLKPLASDEAKALLEAQGREIDPELRERVAARAAGHPLFLEELLRSLVRDQTGSTLPSSVRELIRERLANVSASVRSVLELAAAAGDVIEPQQLARAGDMTLDDVVAALQAGSAAGVVSAHGSSTYRFAHPLILEALEAELSASERARLHASVAKAIAQQPRRQGADAELAHHWLKAGDLHAAVAHAVRAAERALALFADDEAVLVLRRVLDALEASDSPGGGERSRLVAQTLIALTRTHMRRGDYAEGRALCARAAAIADALNDHELLAQAALARGLDLTAALIDSELIAMLKRALAVAPEGDSRLRVELTARLAAAMQPHADLMYPIGLAGDAIASARRIGDQGTLLYALYTGMATMMDIVDPNQRMPLNLEVETLARLAGDRERLIRTQARLVFDHMELGELAAADARIDAFEQLATEAGARRYLWRVPLFRSMRALVHGHFDEAEMQLERARVLGRAAGDPQTERTCVLHHEGLLRAAERHDAMLAFEPEARKMRAVLYSGPHWQNGGSAFTASRVEDEASATRYLSLIPSDDWPLVNNPPAFMHLGEPLAMCGDTASVQRVYERLVPAAGRFVSWGYTGMIWDGPASRVLGLLATRLRRFDDAEQYFTRALADLEQLDAGPYLARTAYEHGRALWEREPERARAALERARGLAEQLGMPGLLRLCDQRLRALSSERRQTIPPISAPARAPLVTLTQEGEIWTVAFEGETARLRDSLGLQYLARLVAAPGQPLHALELAQSKLAADADLKGAVHGSDSGEELDGRAREQYRTRARALRADLEEAEAAQDVERAERVRAELTFLASELSRAVGLGGRSRRAGSAAERARSAVQRRIKSALERLAEAAPKLAASLESTIKTGTYCEYRPELLGRPR